MLAVDTVRAFRRFNVHRAEGLGITEAEDRILEELAGDHNLDSRQAVRYRRNKGAAVEADFAFKEFCVAAIGPFGWFMRRPD